MRSELFRKPKALARKPSPDNRPAVILLHGLWMRSPVMWPLARSLRRRGFACHLFGYPSTRRSVEEHAKKLLEFRAQRAPGAKLFVAHSFGCLVTLHALQQLSAAGERGRFVALAPPFQGSAVGKKLGTWKIGRALLGKSFEWWKKPHKMEAPKNWEIGILAGSHELGAGRMILKLPAPNDGTVSQEESRLPGAVDMRLLKTNHAGIIYSREVGENVARFLRVGVF